MDKGSCRTLEDLGGASNLFDLAVIHNYNLVGDLERFLLIVSYKKSSDSHLVVKQTEPVPQFSAYLGVQRSKRLIQQKYFWLDGEYARQSHTLALAAGKLRWKTVFKLAPIAPLPEVAGLVRGFQLLIAAACAVARSGQNSRFAAPSCGETEHSAERQTLHAGRVGWCGSCLLHQNRPNRGSASLSPQ
jgi:hypothetical protein